MSIVYFPVAAFTKTRSLVTRILDAQKKSPLLVTFFVRVVRAHTAEKVTDLKSSEVRYSSFDDEQLSDIVEGSWRSVYSNPIDRALSELYDTFESRKYTGFDSSFDDFNYENYYSIF